MTSSTSNNDRNLPPYLETARITQLPSTAYYIPNFITEAEEIQILRKVCLRNPGELSFRRTWQLNKPNYRLKKPQNLAGNSLHIDAFKRGLQI